ncbi:MAG: TonB-dependent receptor [Gammaproteobacteria bacterium]|nr:TonB-dependent receptor [Gammaproteobacteria bacterium]
MTTQTAFLPIKTSLALAISISFSGTVLAQDTTSETAEAKGLEVIEVTAQRRVENLQEVPVSVVAISARELERKNVSDVYQMTLNAPSLQIGENNTMSIRGAGTLAFTSTLDSSVAVAFDDINLGRRFLMGGVFNDIEQIEVLSGPQGLLYGKNASAGLINIRTTRPQLDYLEGKFDVEYQLRDTTPGDGTSIISRGTLNVPVSDTSALRINMHYATEDPVAKIVARGPESVKQDETTDDWGVKVKYLNHLSDDLSVYIIGDFNAEKGVAGNFDRTYRYLAPGSSKAPYLEADGVTAGPENFEYGADGANYRDVEFGGFQATVDYTINSQFTLSNIVGWRYYTLDQNLDSDATSANELNLNRNQTDYDQFSNELRLSMDFDEISGQVGLFYFNSSIEQDLVMGGDGFLPPFLLGNMPFCVGVEVGTGGCPYSNDYFLGNDSFYVMDTDSTALFGQFDFALSPQWKLTTGLRYTYDEVAIDLDNFQRYGYFVRIGAPAVRDESNSSDNLSGKVSLQYTFSKNNMAYASVSRGYKGPGYTDSPSTEQTKIFIEPEIVTNYELGVKTNWLDNRLNLNGTVFSQDFDDYQVQSFDGSIGQSIIQNAAELKSEGVELELQALLTDNLTFNANAMYLDSEFVSFPGAACYPQQPGCDENGTFDASGLTPPTAAKLTSTAALTYNFNVFDTGYGYVTVNYYHRDPVNYLIARAPQTRVGNVDQFGLTAGVNFDNGWSVSLFCKNCTDEVVPAAIALDGGDATNYDLATAVQVWGFNSVRNIGMRVGYDF